jgi:hypothetical protein
MTAGNPIRASRPPGLAPAATARTARASQWGAELVEDDLGSLAVGRVEVRPEGRDQQRMALDDQTVRSCELGRAQHLTDSLALQLEDRVEEESDT